MPCVNALDPYAREVPQDFWQQRLKHLHTMDQCSVIRMPQTRQDGHERRYH